MSLIDRVSLDSDWEFFEGVVKVAYVPYDTETDAVIESQKVTGIDALDVKYGVRIEQMEQSAGVSRKARIWNLRAMQLNIRPRKFGVIRETDGTEWVIETVELKSFGSRFTCECYAKV